MKYYKLIDATDYKPLKEGVIYKGNKKPVKWMDNVEWHYNVYPHEWELVDEAAYNKQEGIVPKPRVKKVVEVDPYVFKVGDKVIYIGNTEGSVQSTYYAEKTCTIGNEYTISKISTGTTLPIQLVEDSVRFNLHPEHFKLSTQTKLKQTEMENYSIEGSKALKTAFVEECKLTLSSDSTISDYTYFTSEDKPIGTVQGTSRAKEQHFVLPKDWDKAVKYVTEFNTPKPVFKIGDWVVVLPEDEFYYNCDKENAQQITSIDSLNDRTPYSLNFPDGGTNSYAKVRKATAAEIKAATIARENLYKMAGYVSKIDKSAKTISFGCQTYTKKEVKLLLDAAELCERVGYSAKVKGSGFVVSETDILTPANLAKILEQLK